MCVFLEVKVLCRLDQPKRKLANPHQSEVVFCFELVWVHNCFFSHSLRLIVTHKPQQIVSVQLGMFLARETKKRQLLKLEDLL